MMKPPTNAPTVDPRVARALDAVSPQHRVTFITPEARGPGVVQARPANAPRPEARDEREAPDEGTVLHSATRFARLVLRNRSPTIATTSSCVIESTLAPPSARTPAGTRASAGGTPRCARGAWCTACRRDRP